MEAAPMKSLVSKNSIFLMVMVFLFSFVASMASAVNKQEMFELGERIRVLQNRITDAYEELRKLNEEGGDQAQEQAQIVMAQIKEMKIELQKLQKNLEKLKKGENCAEHDDFSDCHRDDERVRKLSRR
jgi:septal ring factor EnvC (AmiA/AmiB activator)